jgi:hypothetical protein
MPNGMIASFNTSDIVIVSLIVLAIVLIIFFHIQAHSSDCKGQILTKSKTSDGFTRTREAKLSIHDANRSQELSNLTK